MDEGIATSIEPEVDSNVTSTLTSTEENSAIEEEEQQQQQMDQGNVESPTDEPADQVQEEMEEQEENLLTDTLKEEEEEEETFVKVEEPVEDTDSSLRDQESKSLGGAEILFARDEALTKNYYGWDNLRWMAYSGARKLGYFEPVYRYLESPKTFLAWASGDEYSSRQLAIYEEPNLILLLRPPESTKEVNEALGLEDTVDNMDPSSLSSYWMVESVIDPNTCKLRLSPLTTVTSILDGVQENEFRRRSCFELITPMKESSIILSAVRMRSGTKRVSTSFIDSGAFLETSSAEHVLKKVICRAHQQDQDSIARLEQDLSWKHQIILGTLHSYVIMGNKSLLDKGIERAKRVQQQQVQGKTSIDTNHLDPRIVDALDESGRTPLHYACFNRFSSGVLSLVRAGANVDLRVEPMNMTPCHVCCKNLDHLSLGAILAMNKNPNVVDAYSRTPMYLAITEGCTVGGLPNPEALDQCLSVLKAHGGDMGDLTGFRHPISLLASLWSYENLAVVLDHTNFPYPIALQYDSKTKGISQSAYYHYPVHSALISFFRKIKSGCDEQDTQQMWNFCAEADGKLIKCLECLFSSGFEPNERLEGLIGEFNGSDELSFYIGFAPIQILAAAALYVADRRELLEEALVLGIQGLMCNIAEFLVKKGSRFSLDLPTKTRLRNTFLSSCTINEISAGNERSSQDLMMSLERSERLNIQTHEALESMLGGIVRLSAAQTAWNAINSAEITTNKFIFHTDKNLIEDSQAPGGSDEKSCAICWKAFGKLMNRKHRCRIARRHVCDECSSKRVVKDGEEHRISDGQFLYAKAEEARLVSRRVIDSDNKVKDQTSQQNALAARLKRLEDDEMANRDSLFGNVIGSMSKAVFGDDPEEETVAEQTNNSIAGLSAQLNQTRDALNQRGEKLNALAEKSDRLVSASQDFATMAKELNRKTQSGFFW